MEPTKECNFTEHDWYVFEIKYFEMLRGTRYFQEHVCLKCGKYENTLGEYDILVAEQEARKVLAFKLREKALSKEKANDVG